jgi:hypothetical protein
MRRSAEARVLRYMAYDGRGIEAAVAPFFTSDMLAEVPMEKQKVARKLINARYSAYKTAPIRTVPEESTYLEYVGDIDEDMGFLEPMTGLQGSMAMLRYWDADKGRLDSHIIPVFEPLFMPGETDPFGCVYPLHQPGETDRSKLRYAVWTDTEHYTITESGSIMAALYEDGDKPESAYYEHGLGLLPVLFAHAGPPVGQEWMRAGADDVVQAQTVFNFKGTHLNHVVAWETHGQAVATGVNDPKGTVRVGIGRVLALPEGATFRFETPGGSPEAIISAMKFGIESVAYTYDLLVKWAGGDGSTSGEHLRIKEVELTTSLMQDFKRWEVFERDRFKVDRALLAISAKVQVPKEYSVTFFEPHIPESPAEKREEWAWMLDRELITKRQIVKEMNPGITDDALDAMMAELEAATPEPAAPAASPGSSFLTALGA